MKKLNINSLAAVIRAMQDLDGFDHSDAVAFRKKAILTANVYNQKRSSQDRIEPAHVAAYMLDLLKKAKPLNAEKIRRIRRMGYKELAEGAFSKSEQAADLLDEIEETLEWDGPDFEAGQSEES